MAVIGLLLLALAAFGGTVMRIKKPSDDVELGDTNIHTPQQMLSWIAEHGPEALKRRYYRMLDSVYTFTVEPIVVLTAILHTIGFVPIAYVMLGIIAIKWITRVLPRRKKTQETSMAVVTVSEEGHQIIENGATSTPAMPVKRTTLIWRTAREFVFSLPIGYMWYLFIICIFI